MKCRFIHYISVLIFFVCASGLKAQDHCATMPRLDSLFENNSSFRKKFEQNRDNFNLRLQQRNTASQREGDAEITYTIPVVFHIVLSDPFVVTDAQIQAQLEKLNNAFSGTGADSSSVPSWFKPLFAKSRIRFCLAQRTPDGAPSAGITRTTTSVTSFTYDDKVKYISSGGKDSWDPDSYYNVWICRLNNNLLGYATFPEDGDADAQGVVIDYRSLPGGSYTNYNTGKTLCHETGHYFNLYHIWGDDDGACTGTDYVDDTPNQANSSTGCSSGIKTDRCTSGGNGIMYQNYMDYSYDACLIMFTTEQVERMESALLTYRSSLLNAQGCVPVTLYDYDAALTGLYEPDQRLCSSSYSPLISIRNKGSETLTALNISVILNGEVKDIYNWTGSLASWDTTSIRLPQYPIEQGDYTLLIKLSMPNGRADEDTANDILSKAILYYTPVTNIEESFEGDGTLPQGWDILTNENIKGWQKSGGVASTGKTSMQKTMDAYGSGQKALLRLPETYFSGVDSAYLTFNIAAAPAVSAVVQSPVDTLEVLLSQNCGVTYQSLYKQYGTSLYTKNTVAAGFNPSITEWRKDTVNLLDYIDKGNVLLAFRISNYNQSNIYIDDVNVFTVTVNSNLKAKGFMVTPNPTAGIVYVQFYPAPEKLQAIQVYTVTGQLIRNINTSGAALNLYAIDLTAQPPGMYIVRAVFKDRVEVKKIIRK
ncbi:M43 family zinc metalloprotease [Terrimonas sp.]|uniref:M43 family zinc metalloprotease n=1 Tax=Terrimonas sp. TaxID=1914338 RepID=UPI001401DA85|nr:M43 family zinc metalloprotease [Terrimonas sp.]